MRFNLLVAAVIAVVCLPTAVAAQKVDTIRNGLALTPPMGWNSWNTFRKNPTQTLIEQMADAVVASGLKDAGYEYINIDDFWCTGRDSSGKIIVDRVKFPNGMKAVADYIHSKGLKAGIYTNIGSKPSYPTLASSGYYDQDMKAFADWGFDYVKVDVNFAPVRTEAAYIKEFRGAARGIINSGRHMVLSICNVEAENYPAWAPYIGNSWRVGKDIDHTPDQKTQWDGIMYELDKAAKHPEIAGPGHWNDPDMMLIGVGTDGGRLIVMNNEEMQSHFSMWCMIDAPLILGNDLRNMPEKLKEIVTNKEVIAINQDKLGMQATKAYEDHPGLQVWIKKLGAGTGKKYAIALLNRTDKKAEMTLDLNKLSLKGNYDIRDLWAHKNLGKYADTYKCKVPSHGVKLFLLE